MAAIIAFFALSGTGGAVDTAQILRKVEEAGRHLRTMKARFTETKVSVLLDESTVSHGEVTLEVPGRFRWDYKDPQPGVMLVKDGRFARYVPQSQQVFRGPARGEADLLVGFGPGAAGLGDKYDVSLAGEETIGGETTHVLDLKTRKGQSGLFSAIRLWIDAARFIPLQTRLTEPTGDHTTVQFEGVVVNGPLPAKAFDLVLPRGVVEVQ
jgi:outer membrane lipoprotein carrier protein